MADEDKQEGTGAESAAENTGTGTAQATGERQEEKRFTQAELDNIVKREKAKAERSAETRVRKELESSGSSASKEKETKSEQKSENTDVAELRAKLEFSEALDDLEWKPSKDDRDLLRDMFASRGRDAMERLADRLKPAAQAAQTQAAGAEKKAEAKGGEEKAPEKQTPAPGYRSPGSPNGAPRAPGDMPPTQWTKDDIDRMRRDGSFKQELDRAGSSMGGSDNPFTRRRQSK